MSALLKLHEVVVRRQQREILHGISLAFEPGTVTALVGPNGAGKSTLLAVAAGDLRADAGEVSLLGKPLASYKAGPLARERAVMPQEHGVRFAFSVEEVVAMGRLPHPPDPVTDDARVEAAIDAAELQALRLREVQQLSGGESARTTFARVLAQDTPLLLLDEPTAALDLRHQERTLRSVRACAEAGACVIVVLHDLNRRLATPIASCCWNRAGWRPMVRRCRCSPKTTCSVSTSRMWWCWSIRGAGCRWLW